MQFSGPVSDLTVIAFPRKSMSRFPGPVYVPGSTITVSPSAAASMPACMVVYVRVGPTLIVSAGSFSWGVRNMQKKLRIIISLIRGSLKSRCFYTFNRSYDTIINREKQFFFKNHDFFVSFCAAHSSEAGNRYLFLQ